MAEDSLFATKQFKDTDLKIFASLSRDRNPLHMDPLIARRTTDGGRVVHGILLMLYGLDRWMERSRKQSIQRIRCTFKKPVLMNEKVDYVHGPAQEGDVQVTALVEGLPCVEITLSEKRTASGPGGAEADGEEVDEKLSGLSEPLEWEKEDHPMFSAAVRHSADSQWAAAFPRLCKAFGLPAVSALGGLSYIVGMVCPGLYSLFSSLDVEKNPEKTESGFTSFKVTSFDERFHLLELSLNGPWSGSLKAFQRPKPFQQPSVESIRKAVAAGEFANCQALVVGGARGLGELTAKLICAGNGTVYLGYRKGRAEANKISAEIKVSGTGHCHPVHLDILLPPTPSLTTVLRKVNSVYYYPTPPIFQKQPGLFVQRHFKVFFNYYVERFLELCLRIEESATGKVQVYFPSSSAVDRRPNGMTAYAMAKAAAEILIQDVNRRLKKVNVYCSRLPRLGSDQTNSILDAPREDNVAVILPVLREVRNRLESSTKG